MDVTLSGIQNYSPHYLTDTADHLTAEAGRAEDAFTSARDQVAGSTWAGQGAVAALDHYSGDMGVVLSHADQLRQAARMMNHAAEVMSNARAEVLAEVSQAQQNGFTVEDDFSVHDDPSLPPAVALLREPYVQAHAAALAAKVAAFTAQEKNTALTLSGHAATLGAFQFPDRDPRHQVGCPREQEEGACTDEVDDQGRQTGGTTVWPTIGPDGKQEPGTFNDNILIDQSTVTGPDQEPAWAIAGQPPVKPDWPAPSGLANAAPSIAPPDMPATGYSAPLFGAAPTQTGGNGRVQLVDRTWKQDTSPTPTPNPWTDPGGMWAPAAPPAGAVGPPPPLEDPQVEDLQNRVRALEHPQCSVVDWGTHGFGLGASLASTLYGIASAPTGLGMAVALLGAGGVYWQGDALIKCYNGMQ